MLEGLTSVMGRIEEIKAHFKHAAASGVVHVAPHLESGELTSRPNSVKPFFPSYLVEPVKDKVKGSVETVSAYDDIISGAAQKWGVDPALVKAVIQAESGFRTDATSPAGARGLMQLMPSTAASLGVSDPYDPEQNIYAGTRYLKGQLDRFGGDVEKALAAYNAGPAAVIRYDGVPPYQETQNYVQRVLAYQDEYAGE